MEDSMIERWLRVADDQLNQAEPTEAHYILAMMCANHAWDHCEGHFPTASIFHIYRGICNESLAKENITLGLWSQAIFSTAEAVERYNLAKRSSGATWEQEAAARGVMRCTVMQKQIFENRQKVAASPDMQVARCRKDTPDEKGSCS